MSMMNERIREIGREAGMYMEDKWPGGFPNEELLVAKKFAELIMLECVNAVMDGTKEGDHYAQLIEQHFDNGQSGVLHFGVKE